MAEVVVKLESIRSQKRENVNSVIDEGRFIYKVMSFFTGRVDMILDNAVGRKSVMPDEVVGKQSSTPDHAESRKSMMLDGEVAGTYEMPDGTVGRRSDFSGLNLQLSNNRSVRHFTYTEVVRATNNFKHTEHSSSLNELIYKGWVDERTYAPTKYGVGLTIYVRKKYIETWKVFQYVI